MFLLYELKCTQWPQLLLSNRVFRFRPGAGAESSGRARACWALDPACNFSSALGACRARVAPLRSSILDRRWYYRQFEISIKRKTEKEGPYGPT